MAARAGGQAGPAAVFLAQDLLACLWAGSLRAFSLAFRVC